MFGWACGALLVLLVSRFGKGGIGPTFPLFALFLGASLMIYVCRRRTPTAWPPATRP